MQAIHIYIYTFIHAYSFLYFFLSWCIHIKPCPWREIQSILYSVTSSKSSFNMRFSIYLLFLIFESKSQRLAQCASTLEWFIYSTEFHSLSMTSLWRCPSTQHSKKRAVRFDNSQWSKSQSTHPVPYCEIKEMGGRTTGALKTDLNSSRFPKYQP